MIEAANFFGPTFVIFNHFQHDLDAIPLKKVEKSNQRIYAIGLVLQQGKYFIGLHVSIVSISTAIHILACVHVIFNFAKKL